MGFAGQKKKRKKEFNEKNGVKSERFFGEEGRLSEPKVAFNAKSVCEGEGETKRRGHSSGLDALKTRPDGPERSTNHCPRFCRMSSFVGRAGQVVHCWTPPKDSELLRREVVCQQPCLGLGRITADPDATVSDNSHSICRIPIQSPPKFHEKTPREGR